MIKIPNDVDDDRTFIITFPTVDLCLSLLPLQQSIKKSAAELGAHTRMYTRDNRKRRSIGKKREDDELHHCFLLLLLLPFFFNICLS